MSIVLGTTGFYKFGHFSGGLDPAKYFLSVALYGLSDWCDKCLVPEGNAGHHVYSVFGIYNRRQALTNRVIKSSSLDRPCLGTLINTPHNQAGL